MPKKIKSPAAVSPPPASVEATHEVVATWTDGTFAYMAVRIQDDHKALHGKPVYVEYVGQTYLRTREGNGPAKPLKTVERELIAACKSQREAHKVAITLPTARPLELPIKAGHKVNLD